MARAAIILLCLLPAAAAAEWRPGGVRLHVDAPGPGVAVTLQHSDGDLRRERLQLSWGGRLDSRWTVHTDLRVERSDGFRTVGAVIGSTGGNARSVLLPAPVDQTTQEWNLAVSFSGQRSHAMAALTLASFNNSEDAFRWQNPFAADSIGQLAQAPDNRASQLALGWAWREPGGLQVNLDAAFGRHRQNETFLPYTVNPALSVPQALPRSSLDGRVSRERYSARMRWPLSEYLELDLRWRAVHTQDHTPPALFVMVAGDAVNQPSGIDTGAARWRLPRDDRRANLESGLQWRLGQRNHLRLAWTDERITRSLAEVGRTVERTQTLEWRRTGTHRAHLRVQRADRNAGAYRDNLPYLLTHTEEYLATLAPGFQFENHPLLRRFDQADRRRDTWQGGLGWSGTSTHLGLSFHHRSDRYRDSVFGLTSSGQRGWQTEFGVATGTETHLTLWLAQERWRSSQDGRHFRGGGPLAVDLDNPDRDWTARTVDSARLAGVSWRHRAPWSGGEFSIDLSESHNTTEVAVTTGPAIASAPLPTVSTRIRRISVAASHRFTRSWHARLAVEHERWRSRDWAYDGVTDATVASVLGLGDGLPQGGHGWVSAQLNWRF